MKFWYVVSTPMHNPQRSYVLSELFPNREAAVNFCERQLARQEKPYLPDFYSNGSFTYEIREHQTDTTVLDAPIFRKQAKRIVELETALEAAKKAQSSAPTHAWIALQATEFGSSVHAVFATVEELDTFYVGQLCYKRYDDVNRPDTRTYIGCHGTMTIHARRHRVERLTLDNTRKGC